MSWNFFKKREENPYAVRYLEGVKGERLAEAALKREGMKLLCRRFRASGGEIDLIFRDGEEIVFVEVKYRPEGVKGDGIEAVTPDKIRRVHRAGDAFLTRYPHAPARIDIVEITSDGVDHVRNVY